MYIAFYNNRCKDEYQLYSEILGVMGFVVQNYIHVNLQSKKINQKGHSVAHNLSGGEQQSLSP